MTLLWGAVLFVAGAGILIASVEGLVESVIKRAAAIGVSGLALGLLATSLDPESTATGVAAAFKNLPGVAIGTQVGSVIFIATLALGVLAILYPFEVGVPPFYIWSAAGATALSALVLLSGRLDRPRGLLLLIVFALLAREATRQLAKSKPSEGSPHGSSPDVHPAAGTALVETHRSQREKAVFIARVAVALIGLIVGAEVLVEGAQRLLVTLRWSQTIFGSIVVAIAVSAEEGLLELLPAHKGHPEVSVGNVLGTIPFLCLASLGAIGVIHPIDINGALKGFEPAALVIAVGAALWCLTRPRTGRHHGFMLVGIYFIYVAGTIWL